MTNLRKIQYQRVFLFSNEESLWENKNGLKIFLAFARTMLKQSSIDFSYAGGLDSIHPSLTIKENIILDAIPRSLAKFNEKDFTEHLRGITNPHTSRLLNCIEDLNAPVCELTPKQLQIVCLIKSFLSKSDYLFLSYPSEFQDPKTLEVIKSAIQFEIQKHNRNVLIKPINNEIWIDLTTHFVEKTANGLFTVSSNPLQTILDKKFNPTFDFTLIKNKKTA